jgi:hypothetical protein
MASKAQVSIERRVNEAISAAIKHHQYVSAIDVLIGMQLLTQKQVDAWRKGQVPYLERVVTAGLGTITRAMRFFHQQARRGGLTPSETAYLARGSGEHRLRFSKSGNPNIERAYRTHFVSKALKEKSVARKTLRSASDISGTAEKSATQELSAGIRNSP